MDVLHPRCAGLDVHKKTVVACALSPGPAGTTLKQIESFGTTTLELQRLASWLLDLDCSHVAMEATSAYWKPVYNILEEHPTLSTWVLNPQHIKAVPGRKTDVHDAEWIATLLRHGLANQSFIPHRQQRDTRELTRFRSALTHDKVAAVNRLQKTLEAANIKLASVLSDIRGISAQRILSALAEGEDDPVTLAALADFRVKATAESLQHALTGRLTPTLRFVVQQHLQHLADLDAAIERCDLEVADLLRPFEPDLTRLDTIPGIALRNAQNILAETGIDLSRFPSHRQLAAWAGLAPGNKRSAGKRRNAPTRKGNPWLKAALVEAAAAAIRHKDGFLNAMYQRISHRRGHMRALVAVAHQILIIIYHLLTQQDSFHDLGGVYFDQRDRVAIQKHAIKQLERLGYHVELTEAA
jgi:transposase